MHQWKLALSTADVSPRTAPILLNGDIGHNLRAARELGYDAIEVHMREDAPMDLQSIRSAMDQEGVCVSMVISGRLNTEGKCDLISEVPYIAAAAMEGMRRYVDVAQSLSAGLVVGWVRGSVPPGSAREPCLRRLAERLGALAEYGKCRNVPLLIEVINRYETNIFNTARETVSFIETNRLENCYVHLDTFHMNMEERDIPRAIRETGGLLQYFHLADNTRHAVGDGSMDFTGILRALKAASYTGYLAVECLPIPDGRTAARHSRAHLLACQEDM